MKTLKIRTEELYQSISKLERLEKMAMERDNDRGHLLDLADEDMSGPRQDFEHQIYDQTDKEDRQYDDYRQQEDDEREQLIYDALDACEKAGVDLEHLKTLVRETGSRWTRWAYRKSLKG